jgi:hypothetical protein
VENCWQQECDIHFRGKKSPEEFVRQNKNKSALGEVELDIREKARSCRWSNGGPGSTGSQGWSKAGIVRFNELIKIIGEWRASREGKQFYAAILSHEKALHDGKKNKRKRCSFEESDAIQVGCNWESV